MKFQKFAFDEGFRVAIGNAKAQAAEMTIPAGGREGCPDNGHRGADQWLFVVAGTGDAIINDETIALIAGSLVLIEAGDRHEIRNTGRDPLKTLSIYVPPAYSDDGDELPAGRA